jgi:hypothetical protein
VVTIYEEALCTLQLLLLLGFLEFALSLSEFGFSCFDLVGPNHSDYFFSNGMNSFRGFGLLVLSSTGFAGF